MKLWGRLLVVALTAVLATSVLPASAEDPPPSITVHADRSTYVAGQTAAITVVVSGAGSGKYLRLTLSRANGTSTVVNSGATDDTFHFDFAMYIDSSLKTELIDTDKTTVLDSDQKVFPVKAAIGSAISGYYQRSGSYAYFAKGSQPTFRSATTPPRKYRCLQHEVWTKHTSGWRVTLLSPCKRENAQGVVAWQWTGTHTSRVHYRVRARFFGDNLNHANSGAFIYFSFK